MGENTKAPEVIIEYETAQSDIFERFDKAQVREDKKQKTSVAAKTIIIALCAVAVLSAALFTLLFMPEEKEEISADAYASVSSVPDEDNIWQAKLKTKDGRIFENGAGKLLSLNTSDIRTIKLENNKGTTIIQSRAPKSKKDAVQYTVKGYEDFELQAGAPDETAEVCSSLSFKSVSCIDAGGRLSDFGFDKPRGVASVTYGDNTKSIITVGANAPQNLGTYVMFGSGKAVFLCETEAVRHLLGGITDLVSLTVSQAADDTENSQFTTLTLSGTNFDKEVVIQPNEDDEIQCDYVIASPNKNFADNTEVSSASGGIRGLYADKVTAVNPNAYKLRKLGLSAPYARVNAVYTDETVSLKASKPDSDGNCYIMKKDGNIVYKISAEKIPWVNSSYEKLVSEYVLEVDLKTVKNLKVDAYSFDITTKTINTTDDKGEESSSIETITKYNGKELDEVNFETFFNNLSLLKKSVKTSPEPDGKTALRVVYSYSSGRSDDTLVFYKSGIIAINGTPSGRASISYIEKLKAQAKAVSKGDEVKSFW